MTDIDRAIDGLAEAIVQPFADLVEILREMVADNDEPDPDIHHDDPFNREPEPLPQNFVWLEDHFRGER
tara:strand:+ start:4382 stop:4588 length:207 start_codon:yes stop_codon:yes gene_type:complete